MQVTSTRGGPGHDAWHLDTVAVTARTSGVTTWFLANRWLDKQTGLEVTLEASDTDLRGQLVKYQVLYIMSRLLVHTLLPLSLHPHQQHLQQRNCLLGLSTVCNTHTVGWW